MNSEFEGHELVITRYRSVVLSFPSSVPLLQKTELVGVVLLPEHAIDQLCCHSPLVYHCYKRLS